MLALMIVQTAAATVFTECGPSFGPHTFLAWPEPGPGPSDGIVVVQRMGSDASMEGIDLVLYDEVGAEIAVDRYDLPSLQGESLAVLAPRAPLPAGTYTVEASDGSRIRDFEVVDAVAEPGGPPVPIARSLGSEIARGSWSCPEQIETHSELGYQLCSEVPMPISLLAFGDSEPPPPTLAELGEAVAGVTGQLWSWPELAPGTSATVWLGGFDGAGRFTGWTPDLVQMPPAQTLVTERAEGAPLEFEGIPGVHEACPTEVVWTLASSGSCELWAVDACAPPAEPEEARACGCATGPSAGLWALGLAGLLALRRRSGSAQEAPADSDLVREALGR